MMLVCAPSHRLAARERVALEDLHGLEVIAFDADLEIRHEIDRALAAKGVEVRVAMEFDNTETIKRAVEIDAGVSLLPAPTVDRELAAGALVARPLVGAALTRPIGIIQRRGKELGKTAHRFMQLLLKQSALSQSALGQSSGAREIAALDDSSFDDSSFGESGTLPATAAAGDDAATAEKLPPAAKSPDSAARVAS
jgi:hypothetical protein